MKIIAILPLLGAASAAIAMPKELNVDDTDSIRNVAATIAYDTMSYYTGNTTSNDPKALGNVKRPYYWWVAGALWGMMVDYYHVTKDSSYNEVLTTALLAKVNIGPDNNYLPPEHADEEGNDDLFFWGNAVLNAAEINFPQPNKDIPSWLEISENVFKWLESRWNTTDCGGGVFWQILASNPNGLNYKNSISNGGFFNLAARLARATNDDSYVQWAEKIWDWSWNYNLIDHNNYHIYDGVDVRTQCQEPNHASFTYLSGIYLHGAAVLANHTGSSEWSDRAQKLLDGSSWFFYNSGDFENVMYEGACEPVDSCFKGNADMSTLKGYLATLMWKSAVMLPSLRDQVAGWLIPTAKAAAQSCQGGQSGTQCGMKWSTGGYDDNTNLGPQMNALGAVQGLLIEAAAPPQYGDGIVRVYNATSAPLDPTRTANSMSEPRTPTSTTPSTYTPASTTSLPTPEPSTSDSSPDSTSDTPSTTSTSSSSESTTLVTSTAPSTPTDAPTLSEISETSTTKGSELPTSMSCMSRTTPSTATDLTLTFEPTSEPTSEPISSAQPIITPTPTLSCESSSTSSPSSQPSISTLFTMPNHTLPGTGLSSSGLTHSLATLPSTTDETDAAAGLTNHVCIAAVVAFGSVIVTWLV